MMRLRNFTLTKQNIDNIRLVDEAETHAENLYVLWTILNGTAKDTQKFSKSAERAARIYSEIVEGIYEALRVAKIANVTANEAKAKVSTVSIC